MRTVLVALVAYYVGVVAPLALAPFAFVGLLALTVAIAWARLLELRGDPRDRPVKVIEIVELPLARGRKVRGRR